MKKLIHTLSILSLILTQVITAPGDCSIQKRKKQILFKRSILLSRHLDFSKGLNISSIQPINSLRLMNSQDVGQIIPNDLSPTSDGGKIATQIIDHSLSSFFNSPAIKNSDIGRTANKVEKTMSGDVAFGGKKHDSVKHNLKFAMKAVQTKAQVEYSGLTNANMSYNIAEAKLDFEVHEKIETLNSQIVYNHVDYMNADKTDMLSMRWNW